MPCCFLIVVIVSTIYLSLALLLFSRSILSDSFAAPQMVAHQTPWSMGLHRQEYSSELPFPSLGDLPTVIEPTFPALASGFFTLRHKRSLYLVYTIFKSHLRILVKNTKILHCIYKNQPLSSEENTCNRLTYAIFYSFNFKCIFNWDRIILGMKHSASGIEIE